MENEGLNRKWIDDGVGIDKVDSQPEGTIFDGDRDRDREGDREGGRGIVNVLMFDFVCVKETTLN